MKLDKRMSAIYSEIPACKNLADIGADHGYISINYAINNANSLVFASDISAKSVEKAKCTAAKYNLLNYKTTVGDGLEPIKDFDIDVVLISGMGGEEIIKILENSKIYSLYILSPQKNADKVRKFLSEKDLCPIKDYKVLSESKFYDIIVCTSGVYKPTEFELNFGKGEGDDFKLFSSLTIKNLKELLEVANDKAKDAILHKLQLLEGAK